MIILKKRSDLLRFGFFLLIVMLMSYYVARYREEASKIFKPTPRPPIPVSVPVASAEEDQDFFAEFRVARQRRMDALRETLKEVMESESADEEAKKQASQQYLEAGRLFALEDRAEAMVKARGFADALVSIAGEGAQVIVRAQGLSSQEFLQVLDMVSKSTGIKPGAVQVWSKQR